MCDEMTLFDKEEEKTKMGEAFMCSECFEPYDGVYCETCGYLNDLDPSDKEYF